MCDRKCCPSPGGHSGGLAAAVVGLVLAVAVWHRIARTVAEVVHVLELAGLVLAAAVVVGLAAVLVARGGKVPVPAWLRNLPRAVWVAVRWRWLCRNTGLAKPDKHAKDRDRRRVLRPRARIWPDAHGVVARVKTCPGAGRAEFELAAEHIGNYWKAARVSVSQPKPGRLVVRGLRTDPLLTPLAVADVPAGVYSGADLTRAYVGRDESGGHRWMQVKDNTAATFAGMPGSGKSVGINGLLMQWAPSPACQFGTADGKAPADAGDYEVWRPRAWRSIGDSREACADMLSDACRIMRERLGCVEEITGYRNAWHAGPTVGFSLFGLVLDEAQRYLDLSAVKGRDKEAEKLVLACQTMAGDFARMGRSVLCFLVLATQKATTDSLPSQIRDNAALSLALAQKTMAACKAALGDDIADYPTFAPTTLQGPEYVGCAIASMRSGRDPFTRVRFPYVTKVHLEQAAAATAHLRRDPAVQVDVPDDARELVP